jgi:hypothetical protein
MAESDTHSLLSSVPPTKGELAIWCALSREEQLAHYREALQAPEAGRISNSTMTDVLTAARQRVAARRG